MTSAAELGALLARTPLEGRVVSEEQIPSTAEVALTIELEGTDPVVAWRVGRALLHRTGRWPMLIQTEIDGGFDRGLYPAAGDQSPTAIAERSEQLSWPRDRHLRSLAYEHYEPPAGFWQRSVQHHLLRTARRCGGRAPELPETLGRFPEPDEVALERFLIEWEEIYSPTTGPEMEGERVTAFTVGETRRLAFLPTTKPWLVPAHIHYWGIGHDPGQAEIFIAALRSWFERFAAEPFAATGVSLAFLVGNPPTTVFDAFALAQELDMFDDSDGTLRESARILGLGDRWDLFSRP